ncbi:MAG: RluA family pseudouridine synthase [Campylobacterales bacterium]|nr:RluA family pseudouridine synthase [Campylobacterales bacterium]
MNKDQAFKVLAEQLGTSNKKAKELIDKGLVYVGNHKVKIARGLVDVETKFRVEQINEIRVIFEDEDIIAIDKPAFIDSYDIQDSIEGATLIHRLDRDTSGVLLLAKNEDFLNRAIEAFKQRKVTKKYIAWVDGIFYEEMTIDEPIHTDKRGKAISRVDKKRGKKAVSIVRPIEVQGKKSKVEIEIETGRTHQIRVHLAYIGYPIIGDELYGSFTKSKRILLHAASIALLGYSFQAKEPKDIERYK